MSIWVYFIAVLSVVGYALQPSLSKILGSQLQPFTIMAINAFITLIVLSILSYKLEIDSVKNIFLVADKRTIGVMLLYSFCSVFATYLFFVSIKKMDVVHYELIYSLCPIIAAGLAYFILGEAFKVKYLLSFTLVILAGYIAIK